MLPLHTFTVLSAFACICIAEEAACATAIGDDSCLLQSGVGVLTQHSADTIPAATPAATPDNSHLDADAAAHPDADNSHLDADVAAHPDAGKSHVKADVAAHADLPVNNLKIARDVEKPYAAGGLGDDLPEITTFVTTFSDQVHAAGAFLADSMAALDNVHVKMDVTLDKVHDFFNACGNAASKLEEGLAKVTKKFIAGVSKAMPGSFTIALNGTMTTITHEAHDLADSFKKAATEMSGKAGTTNTALSCKKASEELHVIHEKVDSFIISATGMTTTGLKMEILTARELLSQSLKGEIDAILDQANKAFSQVQKKLKPEFQEIKSGVSDALKDKCDGLTKDLRSGSSRVEVGFLALGIFALAA